MTVAQKTPLYEAHLRWGGKIVDFAGWFLPVQYAGILEEHRTVREKAGLFDVSHMGEVLVKGPGALVFLQKLVTNDVSRIVIGQIQYSPMCYPDGGTVDDLLIYRLGDEDYLIVINAGNIAKDWAWMQQEAAGYDVVLTNLSDQTAELALQGPLAQKILKQLTSAPLDALRYYWFFPEATVAGKKTMLSRTGYTGEDGFEIYCRPEDAVELWDAILDAGKPYGLQPVGLGCRDTLRFEACMPLYGHELSPEITPIEAGLGRYVQIDKEGFNGKAVLAEQKAHGGQRKLVGFEMIGRGIARAEYPVKYDGQQVGTVTTGSFAPTLDKNLGLALIKAEYAEIGRELHIEIRGKDVQAQIIPKPFYKREGN
jgi:aminomethyltransferase